jgi:hypothetical protein
MPQKYRDRPTAAPNSLPRHAPPVCRSPRAWSRADRSDPPPPHAQAPLARRATHRYASLVSAESQIGTLPFSLLLLRRLLNRSALGRSGGGATPHPQQPCALTAPTNRRTPWDGVPLEYSVVTSRARVPSESTATSPAAAPPRLDAPDMHPPTCRALGAEPTDPNVLGRTRKRRWQEGGTYRCARLVSVESELGTPPVSLLL